MQYELPPTIFRIIRNIRFGVCFNTVRKERMIDVSLIR
jgi:hypothetical protein